VKSLSLNDVCCARLADWAEGYALCCNLQWFDGSRVRYALPARLSWHFCLPTSESSSS
jgi:hypothetical protein